LFDGFSSEVPGFGTLPEFPIYHAAHLWQNNLIVSSNSSASSFCWAYFELGPTGAISFKGSGFGA
jgi:hypothetical protein